jgi:hypothetical protein
MPRHILFSELSPPRRALVRLCQALNYGQIQDICVRDGDPVLSPSSAVLVEFKLDADEEQRKEAELVDFELRSEVRRLMFLLDKMKDGRIECIEVRAGIPRRAMFKSPATSLPK